MASLSAKRPLDVLRANLQDLEASPAKRLCSNQPPTGQSLMKAGSAKSDVELDAERMINSVPAEGLRGIMLRACLASPGVAEAIYEQLSPIPSIRTKARYLRHLSSQIMTATMEWLGEHVTPLHEVAEILGTHLRKRVQEILGLAGIQAEHTRVSNRRLSYIFKALQNIGCDVMKCEHEGLRRALVEDETILVQILDSAASIASHMPMRWRSDRQSEQTPWFEKVLRISPEEHLPWLGQYADVLEGERYEVILGVKSEVLLEIDEVNESCSQRYGVEEEVEDSDITPVAVEAQAADCMDTEETAAVTVQDEDTENEVRDSGYDIEEGIENEGEVQAEEEVQNEHETEDEHRDGDPADYEYDEEATSSGVNQTEYSSYQMDTSDDDSEEDSDVAYCKDAMRGHHQDPYDDPDRRHWMKVNPDNTFSIVPGQCSETEKRRLRSMVLDTDDAYQLIRGNVCDYEDLEF